MSTTIKATEDQVIVRANPNIDKMVKEDIFRDLQTNPYTGVPFQSPEELLELLYSSTKDAIRKHCPEYKIDIASNDPLISHIHQSMSMLRHQLWVANGDNESLKRRVDELDRKNTELQTYLDIRNSHWRLIISGYQRLVKAMLQKVKFSQRKEIVGQLKLIEAIMNEDINGEQKD